MKITFLIEEWTQSTKGGRSTLIRQLAIELAKLENVEISIFIPIPSPEDKEDAKKFDVKVFEPEKFPGMKPVECLPFLPEGFSTHFIISHGHELGRHGAVIQKNLQCQWIHFVVSNAEEKAMFQNYEGAISQGQKEHETEVEFCKRADLVVTVGHKLNESFHSALRHCKREIFNLVPGILEEFVNKSEKVRDSKNFETLVFGRGDAKDFELKGLHVAAGAVAHLNKHVDPTYILKVVGAPEGEQEKLAEKLKSYKISPSQLRVRSFYKERRKLAELFSEVDLVLMPSGTEGFGLTALEALSAGVPILITNNSGLAEALKEIPGGRSCVVNSEADWAEQIKEARKHLKTRLKEANMLRDAYKKKYCWGNQCAGFVKKLRTLHSGCAEEMQQDSQDKRHSAQKRGAAVNDVEKGKESEDGPKAKRRQEANSKQGPSTSEESINLHVYPSEPDDQDRDESGLAEEEDEEESSEDEPSASGQDPAVKEGNPENDELEQLAKYIDPSDWKKVARMLKIDDPKITAIDKENAEFHEKKYKMLRHWKQKIGRAASWEKLYQALVDADLMELAEKHCCEEMN